MNPFQSLRDYEEFVYTLHQKYPGIQRSTLVVSQRGKRVAVLQGEISFTGDYRIVEPSLAGTYPHHKHIPPDIKHNRIPAANMHFTQPNIPALINDIENLMKPIKLAQ